MRLPAGDHRVKTFASDGRELHQISGLQTRRRARLGIEHAHGRAAKQPPADKIKVLEDTDGDGRADRVVVFAEGLFCPMSICVAGSKVYVATSPDVPGLVAEGRSIVETVEIAQGLARKIAESFLEHGDPLPPSLSQLLA